ncbi:MULTISPECIES: EAL domain-containing protein [unclassified Pseudomonas]|uniref:EAL domain-containing response regulator n=1 Tax=unclassified Pseudomonas TaxID=196821 RepID=UPI000BCAF7DE|nr:MULTISPECIES: EAL domain-containing response regulator [unclassified Pseudomonas]PVZ12663.1 EAL domain-containing protein (putative c-di-GMP-specific phosphodiesterase class I) [Pseudomonas sp. URIL14HWK12:I12]PVZ23186.1 EAL domain-containing protein (putative c-di-GMP-specific phosphodiesterase class I) [Pseudomonas sp. URIL14HWK12:I10]PVZ32515.1 EAL domain-containing protein (putative c-di-GMP-specific phosphodiesterase class I) [Pseudomonas sp. URIL14HWK12:I11]SNZ13578.1 EAL domain, c-di-
MSVYRVLIVEDHPFQHQYLNAVFQAAGGFAVDLVWDAESALQHLARQRYDLLLSDLMMPRMDGVQLIQQLARLRTPPALALMTAASRRMLVGSGQVAKNLGLRVAGLISKPVSVPQVQALRNSLDQMAGQPGAAHSPPKGCRSQATLAQALQHGEIQAWFQPKKSLCDGRIVGAEALARWLHPAEGLLLPGAFLGDIERHALETPLLAAMLQQTLAAQAQWAQLGYRLPVSINLPTHLLDQNDLVDNLLAQVKAARAEPRQITFELTESSTTQLSSNYYAGACRLRLMGFGLAQDDFGKGYSSYFNLVSTPFTELKIDRSLVHGCAANEGLALALLSITEIGRKLGLVTIAEGAETQDELAVLRRIGCDQVQGFIISQAVAGSELATLLIEDGP